MFPAVLLSLVVWGAGVQSLNVSPGLLERLVALETQNAAQEARIKELEATQGTKARHARSLENGDQVAFTAYMKSDRDNVPPMTPVVFDGVLLNDGDAYDNTTGIFTAPIQGVYFFSFFVADKDDNQFNIMLTVNKQNWVGAAAEGIQVGHDDQGGNAATVQLNIGDRVQVKHRHVGHHVEGADDLRLSTFSGFLMYATDYPVGPQGPSIVG